MRLTYKTYKTKFLGVMIDSKLNHVAMVKSKLSKSIAIMRKAKHLLDRRSGMILYFSLFLPYLSYCCEVWGDTYSSYIKNVYSRTCLGRPLVWTTTRLGRPQSPARIVSNNKVPGVSDHLPDATSDRVVWFNQRYFYLL